MFFSELKDKKTLFELLKSMAVGIFCNAIDFLLSAAFIYAYGHEIYDGFWGVFSGATVTGVPYDVPSSIYITANAIGFVTAVLLNYILSSVFVFKYGNVGKNKIGFIKFIIISLIGLGITSLGSWIGYDLLGCNLWLTKLVVQFIVFVYNYLMRRFFIYNINLIRDDENTISL